MRLRRAPGTGSAPTEGAELEQRLIWIFGSPRSGSTWLLRLLVYPLLLTWRSSTGARRPLGRKGVSARVVPIDEPYLPQHLTPRVPVAGDPADMSQQTATTLGATREGDPNYFFSAQYADVWRPALRSLILARVGAQAERCVRAHDVHDPLVAIKEPNGSYGAEFLMPILPRSRMVFLIRDGRDVVDSFIDAMTGDGWLAGDAGMPHLDSPEARLNFARTEARAWVDRTDAVQRAFRAHPEELRYSLRYEDLRESTMAVLRPLLDWLGIERSAEELEAVVTKNSFESIPARKRGPGTRRRAASPGLWRTNLTDEERRAMQGIMAPKLAELGYET